MQAKLTISSNARSYNDSATSNNPLRRFFDWTREVRGLAVENPRSYAGSLEVGESATIFDGVRATSVDGTTAFTSTLSALDSGSRYRFTWVSGTNPVLRTDRGLTLGGQTATFTLNTNQTMNISLGGGTFGTVVAGDIVFIPHTTTGDVANSLSVENAGEWQVLAVVSTTNIQVGRLAGESFSGTGEVVLLATNAEIQAYTSAGVQAGDSVVISAGFAVATRKTFTIDRVTSTWFEVLSTSALPAEASKTPGAAGIIFYTNVKRFVRVEVDQDASVRYNGATDDSNRLSPFQAGDTELVGWSEKCGPAFKLVVVNQSAASLNYSIFVAE